MRSRGADLSYIVRESPTCLFYFKLKLKTLFVPDSAEKKMCKGEKNHSLQGETEGAVLERLEGAIENSGMLAWLHALPSTLTNKGGFFVGAQSSVHLIHCSFLLSLNLTSPGYHV